MKASEPRKDPTSILVTPAFVLPQVNGTMVTNSSHLEVVKLIKCESETGCTKVGGRWAGRSRPFDPGPPLW